MTITSGMFKAGLDFPDFQLSTLQTRTGSSIAEAIQARGLRGSLGKYIGNMLSLADLARVLDALPAVLLVGNLFRRVPIVSLFGAFPVTRLNAAGDSEFVQYFRGTALSERVSHQQSCHLLCAARQDAKRMLAAGEAKAEQIGIPYDIAVVDAGGHLVVNRPRSQPAVSRHVN
jgi:hypothetical protein